MSLTLKLVIVISVIGLSLCRPQKYDDEPPQPYSFHWKVFDLETLNDYYHRQSSDGKTTQGEYQILLPDTRVETVVFQDEGNGYEADVQYQGEPVYPDNKKN